MKRTIADTNAFLRVLLNDIPNQKKAFELVLQKAQKNDIYLIVPQIVIFEIEFVLRSVYHVPKEEIIEKLQTLLPLDYIHIEDRNIFISALLFFQKENISFVDSFLLAKSQIQEAELFTFDKKLQKLASQK